MLDLNLLKKYSKNVSVLYAEDDENARNQFYALLKNIFSTIRVAEDGQEALDIYKETGGVDLVITDITMPNMNGIDLIHNVRQINPVTRCIIISAHSEEEYLFKSINEDVNGYIFKPVNINQLVNTLLNVCRTIAIEKEKEDYKQQLERIVHLQEDQIRQKNKLLLQKTIYDDLTGLYSKAKFAIDAEAKSNYFLIMINIKNFSSINMAFGFDVGDSLLKETANFLREFSEYVYRPEANKFIIVLWDATIEEAADMAKDIQIKSKHIRLDIGISYPIRVILSMGIAEGDKSPIISRRKAYAALRMADKNNIGIAVYQDALKIEELQKELIAWVNKTKNAIENDLIVPFFQPIYNIKTSKIDKFECLVRMIDNNEAIPPIKFLNAASQAGMLMDITKIMIDKSFRYFQDKDYSFSINITNEDMKNGDLVEYFFQKSKEYSIDPTRVFIEILENVQDSDMAEFTEKLQQLKHEGFLISVDDFGAESSNFSRLLKLDVDYIKIDGAFIKNIDSDENARNIAETIIFYAKKTLKKTVAEYVHSKEVFDVVKDIGMDYAQGYYISQPVKDIDLCLAREKEI